MSRPWGGAGLWKDRPDFKRIAEGNAVTATEPKTKRVDRVVGTVAFIVVLVVILAFFGTGHGGN